MGDKDQPQRMKPSLVRRAIKSGVIKEWKLDLTHEEEVLDIEWHLHPLCSIIGFDIPFGIGLPFIIFGFIFCDWADSPAILIVFAPGIGFWISIPWWFRSMIRNYLVILVVTNKKIKSLGGSGSDLRFPQNYPSRRYWPRTTFNIVRIKSIQNIPDALRTDARAEFVELAPIHTSLEVHNEQYFSQLLEHRVVRQGDIVSFMFMGSRIEFAVTNFEPKADAVIITKRTKVRYRPDPVPDDVKTPAKSRLWNGVRNEDRGGTSEKIKKIRGHLLTPLYWKKSIFNGALVHWAGMLPYLAFPVKRAAQMKRVFDSLLHHNAFPANQVERLLDEIYFTPEAWTDRSQEGHQISVTQLNAISKKLCIHKRWIPFGIIGILLTTIAFIAGCWNFSNKMLIINEWEALPEEWLLGVLGAALVGLSAVTIKGISNWLQLVGIDALPSIRVVVETGGVRYATAAGEKFIPFTTDLVIAPHDSLVHEWSENSEDAVVLTRLSDIRHRTFVGPMENLPLFYLDLIDKYHKWLVTQDYFLSESSIREQYLLHDPVKMRLLKLLKDSSGHALP